MEKLELQSIVHLGRSPATINYDIIHNGIYLFTRILDGNEAALDFENEFDSEEGPLRIRFSFDSFDEMVCSVEKFVGKKLSEWKRIFDEGFIINKEANWDELKKDFYNRKIPLLSGYKKININDRYWDGLYKHKISPDSSK